MVKDESRITSQIREVSPCKNCTEKYLACHDHCKRFADWKAEIERVKANRKEYERNLSHKTYYY